MIHFKFLKKLFQPQVKAEPTVKEDLEEKRLKIAYTVYPDEKLEYNEFWKRIHDEAKKI